MIYMSQWPCCADKTVKYTPCAQFEGIFTEAQVKLDCKKILRGQFVHIRFKNHFLPPLSCCLIQLFWINKIQKVSPGKNVIMCVKLRPTESEDKRLIHLGMSETMPDTLVSAMFRCSASHEPMHQNQEHECARNHWYNECFPNWSYNTHVPLCVRYCEVYLKLKFILQMQFWRLPNLILNIYVVWDNTLNFTWFHFLLFLSDPGIPGVRSMGPSLSN